MSKIADLEKERTKRLAEELLPRFCGELTERGMFTATIADPETANHWRAAAVICGRQLGIRHRVSIDPHNTRVLVMSLEPSTPEQMERARHHLLNESDGLLGDWG